MRPIHEYSSFKFLPENLRKRTYISENRLASPADGRVLAYQYIKKNKVLQIKDSYFTEGSFG